MNTNESGARLRELRTQAGLTQQKLAKLSGVHEVNICKMEAGKLPIGGKSLLRLARTLEANPFYLAGESSEKISQKN
jgi:transcriptional regulator with XRE-family HTH domain